MGGGIHPPRVGERREGGPGRRVPHCPEEAPMNATHTAAALAARAEQVCRRYLPNGRKRGRYWTAGDARGAKGRSLFVRLAPPGAPGKWTDAATGEHGDLLDLIRIAIGAAALKPALDEARAFLAMPAAPAGRDGDAYDRVRAARRLWRACRAIDGTHAEAYLEARAIHRCRFHSLRFHPALNYRDRDGFHRLPALVAAVTADGGAIDGIHRTWLDPDAPAKATVAQPRKALGHVHGRAVRFGKPHRRTLLVGEGIETVLSLIAAVPAIPAAAALSAGSLGAFAPPCGLARLVIARDNDPEGERAARRLRRRCGGLGIATAVVAPQRGDFNDDLIAFGPQALAARIAPLFHTPDRDRAH